MQPTRNLKLKCGNDGLYRLQHPLAATGWNSDKTVYTIKITGIPHDRSDQEILELANSTIILGAPSKGTVGYNQLIPLKILR